MKYYLKDIITRLQKYSATLDQDSFLVDKPWVVSNNGKKFEKLIFKRDKNVILSVNGDVTIGKWEYLPEAQALLVDYGDKKKLYRHQYLDEAVLALKIDGPDRGDENYYLLANENIVQDYDAKKYLLQKQTTLNAFDTDYMIQEFSDGSKKLSIADKEISDGKVYVENDRSILLIKNGKIKQRLLPISYRNGIEIWQKSEVLQKGDIVMNKKVGWMSVTSFGGQDYKLSIGKDGTINSVSKF